MLGHSVKQESRALKTATIVQNLSCTVPCAVEYGKSSVILSQQFEMMVCWSTVAKGVEGSAKAASIGKSAQSYVSYTTANLAP